MAERGRACRFIDECFDPCPWCATHDYSEACVPMMVQRIKQLEERDAVEVVHGRWENGSCTNCGQVDFSKPNYCPNCGAKMDGERSK